MYTDQTPHSATSDLGLHCLPMSIFWDARHKWINAQQKTNMNYIARGILFKKKVMSMTITMKRGGLF